MLQLGVDSDSFLLLLMQRLFLLIVICALTFLRAPFALAEAGDPSDLFLNAYLSVQQAEKLDNAGNFKAALAKYRYAATLLEQIQKNSPDWQPLIIDYRKKKTTESISRLQEKISVQAPEARTIEQPPLPQKDEAAPPQTTAPTVSIPSATDQIEQGTREIRNQILELQNQLKSSKDQLRSVQQQKEDLAKQLSETSKQLDKGKVTEAEIKAKLQSTQEAAKNSEEPADSQTLKNLQAEVSQLQNALKEAQADRDAADEQNAELAHKTVKAKVMVERARKERDEATQKITVIESKYKTAQNQLGSIIKERDEVTKKASELESKFSTAEKAIKELETAKADLVTNVKERDEAFKTLKNQSDAQIATLTKEQMARLEALIKQQDAERDTEQEKLDELSRKLAGAKKQVVELSQARDENGLKLKDLTSKSADTVKLIKQLESAQVQIVTVTKERDAAVKQNADIEIKFSEIEKKTVETERQRAELAKRSADEQALVASLTKERNGLSTERNDLLAEISKIKTGGLSGDEKKKQEEENGLLRGIVMRQLKEQA